MDYHMHVEGQMLKQFAQLLIEMLTGKGGDNSDLLDGLEMDDIELKCILYECLNAEKKTLKREEERYAEETKRFIEKQTAGQNRDNELDQFKEIMEAEKASKEEETNTLRRIQRKPQAPQANLRNFDRENERMGVTSVIDLILDQANKLNEQQSRHKLDDELIKFSQDADDKVKKAKEQKYLTIKGLLDHPYFIEITETDISKVIDEFEKFETYRS